MKLASLFSRKKPEVVEEQPKEEWEKFDLKEFSKDFTEGGGGGSRGKSTFPPIQKDRLGGMSAHPQDQDLSFEELMSQYQQYEREMVNGGGTDGTDGLPSEVRNIMQQDLSTMYKKTSVDADSRMLGGGGAAVAGANRSDLLVSRHGKAAAGVRAQISTADVDRRASLPRTDTADGGRLGTQGSVRWATADEFSRSGRGSSSPSHNALLPAAHPPKPSRPPYLVGDALPPTACLLPPPAFSAHKVPCAPWPASSILAPHPARRPQRDRWGWGAAARGGGVRSATQAPPTANFFTAPC